MYFDKNIHQATASDCERDYPCPCRRGASLIPIYLTDAYGCDRCPQMFVLNEQRELVEQLTAGYPYARIWRWTGEQWRMIYPNHQKENSFRRTIIGIGVLVLGWFLLGQWLVSPFSWLYWGIGGCVIFILPAFHRRIGHR